MTKANKNQYRDEKYRFEVVLTPGEKLLMEESRQIIINGEGVNTLSNKDYFMALVILGKYSVRRS